MAATQLTKSLDAALAGTRVGKYEIVQRLAFGGMAEIYLARASGIHGFEKYVVLKRILPQYAADKEFVRMFLREAKLAATLDQANIAHVYDIGEVGGGYFYTMEYLHGEDLRAMMRALKSRELRMPLEHAIGIVLGAASGLHYAHEKKGADGRGLGIVHRDVSPSNIVVTFDGGVKVVDFGIAKVTSDPELSRGYSFKGKLAYMSPEQMNLQPIDRRSDVFSLGVVLYEITTHKRLFTGSTDIEVVRQMLKGGVPRPSLQCADYPADLEPIVTRALEKDPDRRYATARELQRDLEAFARRHAVPVSSTAMAEWMESTFGPKIEAWHDQPAGEETPVTSPELVAVPAAGERSGATKIVSGRPDVIDEPAAVVAAAPSAVVVSPVVPASPRPLSAVAPPPRRRVLPRVMAAGALLVMVALAVVTLARRRPVAPSAVEAAPGTSVVMLVAEGGNVAIEHGTATAAPVAAPVPAATAVAPPPAPPRAAIAARAPGSHGASRRRSAATARAPDFSASLARHERELRACFDGAGAPAAEGADEISFRFQIRADGHVAFVDVLPESIGSTKVGACLRRVGAATVFPAQAEPVSFRIPVSLKVRVAAKTEGRTEGRTEGKTAH